MCIVLMAHANKINAEEVIWVNALSEKYYGMEAGDEGWWMQHPDNWSISSDIVAPGGNYSLKYTNANKASEELKVHGSSSIPEMLINVPKGSYTMKAMVWIEPESEISGFKLVLKPSWKSCEFNLTGTATGQWVEIESEINLSELGAENSNVLLVIGSNHGGKGTLYIDNIQLLVEGEPDIPLIPFQSQIKTAPSNGINAQQGIYDLSLNVWVDDNTSVKQFYTYITQPWITCKWEIGELKKGEWTKLTQRITINEQLDNAEFRVQVNNHPDYGGGTGLFYIDDVALVFISDVGLNKNEDISFSLFPNPANNFVNVKLPNVGEVYLYNINGKLLKSSIAENVNHTIDIQDLSVGVYIVKGITSYGYGVQKLQINH